MLPRVPEREIRKAIENVTGIPDSDMVKGRDLTGSARNGNYTSIYIGERL